MKKKLQILKSMMGSYFITVTLINIAIFLLGTLFNPEQQFGYEAFLSPLIYGLVAFIPLALFSLLSSGKELTLKQMIIRKISEIAALETILIFFGLGKNNISTDNLPLIIGFALSVFCIYSLVVFISWLLDLRTAKRINTDLQEFQSRHSD